MAYSRVESTWLWAIMMAACCFWSPTASEGMDNRTRGYVDATCVVILDTRIIRRHVGMRDANVA